MTKDTGLSVVFLTLCDLASITREGKLNILGIFQQIFVGKLPSRYLKFAVVGIVSGESDSDIEVGLEIVAPNGEAAMTEQTVALHIGAGGRTQLIFDVINLPLPLTGVYEVVLKVSGEVLGRSSFEVIKTEQKSPVGGIN